MKQACLIAFCASTLLFNAACAYDLCAQKPSGQPCAEHYCRSSVGSCAGPNRIDRVSKDNRRSPQGEASLAERKPDAAGRHLFDHLQSMSGLNR
jgi:hypothetical protein